jgi:STE24 endopeptidase
MRPFDILLVFLGLRLAQHLAERGLARLNRNYYLDQARQRDAARILGIADADMAKTLAYTNDKFRFGAVASWVNLLVMLGFLAAGGLGLVERWASALAASLGGGEVVTGLCFFAILGSAGMALGTPFEYYRTFVIEERHGFNRQTRRGFWLDRAKGLALAAVIGAPLVAVILWIMGATGPLWWIWAWAAMTLFSILTAWLYPTFLAPLFNKFSEVTGELKDQVTRLAERVGFRTAGIYVMDASIRSSHGNAYFTGVFGKKRIVLFDTLIQSMSTDEVVAVLAHELGHFKLHHVRWSLIRGTLMTGLTFFLLSRCLPLAPFYQAFGLAGVTSYGALVVFGLWFGVLDFVLQPLTNHLSRRNEFAADAFARQYADGPRTLGSALLKLREKSHAMPLTHPLFSGIYHSHPPMLERLAALGYTAPPAG